MSFCVCTGAILRCPFGAAGVPFSALPTSRVMAAGRPMGTMADALPMVNIPSFGMCRCPANPAVAAATAAALGVLTPMPCVPAPAGVWLAPSPKVLIGGQPAMTDGSMLLCAWGGLISVSSPGQTGVQG